MSNNKTEFEYLLHLLKSVLENTQPQEKPEELSFERLFALSREHSVANMAFYAVEKLEAMPPEPLLSDWQQLRDKAIVKDINQLSELELISEAMSAAGVRFLPLKGSVLKSLYPQSDMRTMSDIDMLIDEENAEKAREIMLSLGYSCEHFGYDVHDIYYKKPVMNVEIHRALFGEEGQEFREIFKDPMSMCEPTDSAEYRFTDESCFAYILAHAAKHYNEGGTGIRSFMDIRVYLNAKGAELDLERIFTMLEPSGFSGLARDFVRLSEIWFGGAESSEKNDKMTAYILSCGTYGTIQNSVENKVRANGKLHYLFRLVFPTFEHMKQHYPVLKKAPVLLPVCWLIRLVTKPFINRRQNAAKVKALMKNK